MSNRDSEFGETYGLTNHKISDGQDWTLDDTIRRGFIRKVYGILSAQLMLTFGKNTRAISSAFGFRFWSSFVTGRQADRQTGRQTGCIVTGYLVMASTHCLARRGRQSADLSVFGQG